MCVRACVLLLDLFQDDLRCLFSPHQVNHGGVQKAPVQVSLYTWLISKNPYQQSIDEKELIVDKVVLINKEPW